MGGFDAAPNRFPAPKGSDPLAEEAPITTGCVPKKGRYGPEENRLNQNGTPTARDKGHEALWCAADEFAHRNPLNRVLARTCVGRKPLVRLAVTLLRGVVHLTDALGAQRAAILALSGIYNMLYWQGAADELGGAQALWNLMSEWRREAATTTPAAA